MLYEFKHFNPQNGGQGKKRKNQGPNKIFALPLKNFFSIESNKVLFIIITIYILFGD